jgi:hypothetical protein
MFDRLMAWWKHRGEGEKDTADERVTAQTAARGTDALLGGTEGGGVPPNYVPPADEGRPKK